MKRLVTIKEAATLLGLSPQQTLNRVKRGKFKAKKVGWVWMVYTSSITAELRRPHGLN